MILTEEKFLLYMECPLKYDLKVNKKIILDTPDIRRILNKTVRAFYMTMITKGTVMTFNTLSKKFESALKPYENVFEQKKVVDSLFLLRNFYNWACDNRIVVTMIDEPYVITRGEDALEGVLSPVSFRGDGAYEILKMNFGQRQYDEAVNQMNVKNAIDTIAFNSFGDDELWGIKVHHVKSGKDLLSSSSDIDINRFYSCLDGVIKSIKSDIYYSRDGFQCERCEYKNICRGWKK